MSKMKEAFRNQKDAANRRGIEFNFTFEEWVKWWEQELGPYWFQRRGCRRGQYVMARKADEGPYQRGNVKAITAEQNIINYNKSRKRVSTAGWSKLPDEIVIDIYLAKGTYLDIARRYSNYKMTTHKIQCIKQKHYYKKITDEFDRR